MINLLRLSLVFLSATTIIIADSIIKKISIDQTFFEVIKNPWTILIYALYLIQIFFAILIFVYKGELAIYTNLFIIFYGIFGIIIGVFFFKETLSVVQLIGISLGLFGAILMSI